MTYLLLAAAVVGTAAAVLLRARRGSRSSSPSGGAIAWTLLVLVVLTVVFDNLMIAVGLFGYRSEHLVGISLGLAPLEDLSYPLAAALLVPALWHLLERAPLAELLVASRPLSWVNTAYPFAAAYLMTAREVDLTLVVGTLFFLVPYNLLMYGVNDVFDHESDLRNPRKGGVEGAVLDRRVHRTTLRTAAWLPVPFVAYLVLVGSPVSWAVLVLSLAAVLAYSVPGLRFKERPVLDSLTSSTHFVSPALYGLVLADAPIAGAAWPVLAAFFVWGAASQAFGAVQDIAADRAAGIGSVATALGARTTVRLSLAGYLLAGLLLLAVPWPGRLAAVLVLPYAVIVAPYLSVTDDDAASAHRGWRRFLGANYAVGFAVTMLLIAVARG